MIIIMKMTCHWHSFIPSLSPESSSSDLSCQILLNDDRLRLGLAGQAGEEEGSGSQRAGLGQEARQV